MPAGYWAFVGILAALIYVDARRFDWTDDGFSKAWHWSVGMLIIWPVVVVLYLMRRRGWHLERDGDVPPAPGGEKSARQKMDEARVSAIDAIKVAQTVMRDELDSM